MTPRIPRKSVGLNAGLERRLQKRGLQVILGGKDKTNCGASRNNMSNAAEKLDQERDGLLALNMLESNLKGENWFLEQVRASIRETIAPNDPDFALPEYEFKTLLSKNGHDNLIHVAQFYFLLNALQCRTPDQVEAFIEAHNEKVETELGKDGRVTRAAALQKTKFSVNDITQVRMTLLHYKEPVFAVTELGYFLADLMSPGTTTNLIKDLVKGGVFEQLSGPALIGNQTYIEMDGGPMSTDPRRKLIQPKKQFLEDYQTSLLMARQRILASR